MTIFRFSCVAFSFALNACGATNVATRCAELDVAKIERPELRDSWMQQSVENGRCIKGQAFKLVAAPGSNRDISEAAVQACAVGIEYEAAQLNERDLPIDLRSAGRAPREKALNERYAKEALLNVVRARAGQCEDK